MGQCLGKKQQPDKPEPKLPDLKSVKEVLRELYIPVIPFDGRYGLLNVLAQSEENHLVWLGKVSSVCRQGAQKNWRANEKKALELKPENQVDVGQTASLNKTKSLKALAEVLKYAKANFTASLEESETVDLRLEGLGQKFWEEKSDLTDSLDIDPRKVRKHEETKNWGIGSTPAVLFLIYGLVVAKHLEITPFKSRDGHAGAGMQIALPAPEMSAGASINVQLLREYKHSFVLSAPTGLMGLGIYVCKVTYDQNGTPLSTGNEVPSEIVGALTRKQEHERPPFDEADVVWFACEED